MAGEWSPGGQKLPLTRKRADEPTALRRPQHPKPPFPYRPEAVTFDNPAVKVVLAGTLTRPYGEGPFPAAVLVSGPGPQDLDDTLFGHKPFLVLADVLTRRGVAVPRYDDGVGPSTAAFAGASSATARADDRPDGGGRPPGRRRLPGAPGRPRAAGQGRAGLADGRHPSWGPGRRPASGRLWPPSRRRWSRAAVGPGTPDDRKKALAAAATAARDGLSEADRKAFDATGQGLIDEAARDIADPWFVHFLRSDPVAHLAKVRCPVPAVNGSTDTQVVAGTNLAGIATA